MTVIDPPLTIPRIAAAMLDLVDCLCNELTLTGAGPTCWCGIWPGEEVAWDYCEECESHSCGMGWVRLVGSFPYDIFPSPTLEPNCNRPLAYYIEVGAIRCMPTAEEDGSLPSPDVIAETAVRYYADMEASYRALMCCQANDISIEGFTPGGPSGGCVGGAWLAYISLD